MCERVLIPLNGSALAEKELPHAIAQAGCLQALHQIRLRTKSGV